ncbi:trans-1,2-dihydrobenzene-1,2-diol dehydrogenase-like isoform X2 [Coccinella septempunctata]|nr:trans-1,2-dihydrobenzene-1,2-diol dehydrogenase-like isoform X2 [Coccinella septempunctata]
MPPLRWGVVGAGRITHDFVTAVQIFPEEHTVVAVGSGIIARAENFAKEHNIPKAYDEYGSIAKDKDIDVVYIGNLNPQHYCTVKMMLENGKPVLCEKPLTLNEKLTTDLVNLARCKQVFLMEAVWSRCFPAYRKLEELIADGNIGEVLYLNVNFGFDLQNKERVKNKDLGGGAILDIGVYCLQFQQFVFRGLQPTKMVVNGSLTQDGVDGTTGALISYPGGKLASITCSAEVKMPNEAIIVGTKGTLRIPNFWCPTEIKAEDQTYKFDLPQSRVKFNHMNSAGLSYEAMEVKRCLEEGELESNKITLDETIQLARFMDTMRKAVGLQFPEDFD